MGMDNIFMHDAVPTWSGFLYQGRIAVYLAVRRINELREAGNESEIKKYALEMEKCEDIAERIIMVHQPPISILVKK